MIVSVDMGRCTGHRMCAIAAPDVFGSDDYGNATVLVAGPLPADLEVTARRAVANCPEHAITIEE
jgi:ferredoxin